MTCLLFTLSVLLFAKKLFHMLPVCCSRDLSTYCKYNYC